jgi:uncharacterized membrane protein
MRSSLTTCSNGYGAMIGTTICPGVGTIVGGVIGAIIGAWGGEETAEAIAKHKLKE